MGPRASFLVGVLGRSCRCTGVGEITRLHVVTGVLPNHPRAERFDFFHALRLRQLPKAIFQRRARGGQDFSLQFAQGLRVRPDLCLKLLDADPFASATASSSFSPSNDHSIGIEFSSPAVAFHAETHGGTTAFSCCPARARWSYERALPSQALRPPHPRRAPAPPTWKTAMLAAHPAALATTATLPRPGSFRRTPRSLDATQWHLP